MNFNEECIENLTYKEITLKEKKSKIIFLNPQKRRIAKIKIDGCEQFEGKKCDYLIKLKDNNYIEEHFVELKGHNVDYAVKQLENSIIKRGDNASDIRKSYVITVRSPLAATEIQQLKLKHRKRVRSELVVKESGYKTKFEIDR